MRSILIAVAGALAFAAGCANTEVRMQEAAAAENTGDFRGAAKMYTTLALELAPVMKLPEAHKGKTMKPPMWQKEMEKYIAWFTDAVPQSDNNLRSALDGLERSVQHLEQDNTGRRASSTPLDTLPAFAAQWDKAFNPPPPETIDWEDLTKQALKNKLSIVQFTAPKSYAYDVNIISRRNARRVSFSIYPESSIFVPLPPAEYAVIIKSTVEFQGSRQRWVSEHSMFNIGISDTVSLIKKDLRTKAVKRD